MERNPQDALARAEFLKTGKVPLHYALRRGMASVFRDPLLSFVMNMTGPAGFKLRQIWCGHLCASFGKGVMIDPGVNVPRWKNVHLADFCYLGHGLSLYAPEGYVTIGKRCHIGGWILGHAGVEIGDYVASGGIILSISDMPKGGSRMAGPMIPDEQRCLKRGKVTIGKDAFIGQHSIVMPGVTIGEGAIVAPFSLVVRNVKPWTVVSGNPAVRVGERERVRFDDPD